MSTTDTVDKLEAEQRILRERAQRYAMAPTEEGEQTEAIEVVQFRLGTCYYAIEARYVFASRWLHELTPVPGAPPAFLGVTPQQGEVLPVVALDVLFGTNPSGVRDLSRVVVVGRTQPEIGLAAGRAIRVTWLPQDEVLQAPDTGGGDTGRTVAGVTEQGLILLDGKALLEDERLFSGTPQAPDASADTSNRGRS